MSDYYNLARIRQLLEEGFNRENLLTLCFDYPFLRPVYENFEANGSKAELVRAVLDRAHRQLALDEILQWAEGQNPKRYARYRPYFHDELGEHIEQKTAVSFAMINDNALGYGIKLGGEYQEKPLQLVATPWTPYGLFREVRSGWLFVPQLSEGHAVAFFKLHALGDGNGLIHLTDVSSPEHPIWLETATGFQKKKLFHYVTNSIDLWQFRWR